MGGYSMLDRKGPVQNDPRQRACRGCVAFSETVVDVVFEHCGQALERAEIPPRLWPGRLSSPPIDLALAATRAAPWPSSGLGKGRAE